MAIIFFYCILLSFILTGSYAYQFRVGGANGWAVPNNTNTESYNQWAGRNRFQVGDSLVFVYNSSEDSVLQVTHGDYLSCSTSQPIASFKDGNTVFQLPRPGSFQFISGASGHCQKSQKLHVIVLAIRAGASSSSPPRSPHAVASPVPAPAPAPVPAPAPLATSTPTHSVPPLSLDSPSPSPSPSPAASPTSTGAPAAQFLQSAGFMGTLLSSLCVFIL